MKEMTPKEREIAILEGGTPDRMPVWQLNGIVASQLYGYQWKDVRFDPKLAVDLAMKLIRESGSDMYGMTCMETNALFMDLPRVVVKLTDNNYGNVMSHYFEEPEDIDKKEFYDPSKEKECPYLWKGILEKVKLISQKEDDYLTKNSLWGVITTTGFLRNVETLMMDVMLEPELAHKAMARGAELADSIARVGLENGADSMILADPTASGSLVSGEMFDEYPGPHLKKMIESYRKDFGIPTYLHVCGESLPVAEAIGKIDFAGFTFDYVTDVADMNRILGDKMILAGNLDPMNVVWMGTPEHVMETSKKVIEDSDGSRFILATGCETPRDTPLKNLQAMKTAVEKYAKY